MLPSVQMHQMVQPSHHLDSSSPFQLNRRQDRLSFTNYVRSAARTSEPSLGLGFASAHSIFPIRSSRPPASLPTHPRSNAFMIPSHLSDRDDHQLRRKTPNGTIDAGYDGNPAQLASGPPPLKHMILPTSSLMSASAYPQQDHHAIKHHVKPPVDDWGFQPTQHMNLPDHGNLALEAMPTSLGGGWGHGYGNDSRALMAFDCISNGLPPAYYPYNNGIRIPTALQPFYQHPPGPAIFDNGGLLPPSAWADASIPSYHPTAHPGSLNYHGTNYQSMTHLHSSNAFMPSRAPLNIPVHYDESMVGLQTPSQGLESLTLEPVQYNRSGTDPTENSAPTRFREKALANAHRSYIELLAYLHHSKKSQSRSSQESKSSKMVIFPRLPRHPSHPNCAMPPRRSQDIHNYGNLNNGTNHLINSQFDTSSDPFGQHVMKQQLRSGEMPHSPFYHSFNSDNPGHLAVDSERGRIPATPLSSAKAAVEMLTHLCEQSGWKWVDGMLLGGCLHYGLEHYEQSLEWFQRITSLDETHVEAISNVAATLYCLNRHEEAERHWLRAVRLRPSYLEAVEHIVGLLCSSHRSREAVEIINFVQQSIRLPDGQTSCGTNLDVANRASGLAYGTTELHGHPHCAPLGNDDDGEESRLPGYGSSGYRVAGNENGRVIALIHAKGNMLYALKDIDQASEAFEEAVLISAGKRLKCIHSLIRRIQSVLSPGDVYGLARRNSPHVSPSGPLLLPPERARHTAQLVFAAHGELPGLRFVPDGAQKRSAISTTSNSLLSLAKIFQDAMSNGGSLPRLMRQPSGIGDILALYYLSLSLSESPSTANNVGILLASVQHNSSTPQLHMLESPNLPQIPGIAPGSGLALALAYYNYGLSLDSKHVHLHTNLGSLLKDIGQLDLAIQMYEQAVACDGNFDIALTNLANAVKDRGRISDAIMYYRRAVNANPEFAEAVCGLSTALNSVCDWSGRGGVLLQGGTYDRWHVDDKGMLRDVKNEGIGSGLMKRVVDIVSKQLADSCLWGSGVLRNGALELLASQFNLLAVDETRRLDIENELRRWIGRPWEGSKILRLVERSMKATMRRWYIDKYVQNRAAQSGYPRLRLPASLAVPAAPTVLPFHTFTCPLTARDVRMISQRNAARISCSTLKSPWLPSSVYSPPPPPNPQLNVGYVSSDFNNHPLAHLMQSVFGFHDPSRAKAFCYATTTSDKSVHRLQIEREAPVFRDVSNWSSEKLVEQIVRDEIHILVNLNGYTRGARNEIFAARPAPIQMSFMGFAGTLGAEWCDYILADETAIPPSTLRPMRNNIDLQDVFRDGEFSDTGDWMYSENIVFCRDTFFCCDHAQSCDADERAVTWVDEQRRRWKMRKELFPNLPDDTIILGNFNQLYKIDPSTFRTWLRILSNVPKAILWLLRFPELGESNLKKTARAWAGEDVASRIIFTDVAPKQQHISRARICDLFLDTPECNAHTTAADVLWSSTPLLTLPRYPYKMCSRMAASILRGALPKTTRGDEVARELIASDDADYEALATKLAGGLTYQYVDGHYCEGYGRLAEMRKILFEAKWTCALFDTHRWVADLERAYEEAWRRWVAGEGGDIYL